MFWTDEKLLELERLYSNKECPMEYLTEYFGTTEKAIRSAAYRYLSGKNLHLRNNNHEWTKQKLWELKEMYENPDIQVNEIARYFGTTEKVIYRTATYNLIKRGKYQEQGYKKCSRCESVLPATSEHFHVNNHNKDGLYTYCKECCREIRGVTTRRTRLTEYQKQYIIKNYGNTAYDVKEIAKHLNLTVLQVRRFASNLRKKGIEIGFRLQKEVI